MISQNEREQRAKAVQFALDNNRLEGLAVDSDVLELSKDWVDGVISYQELQEKVYEIYGI